MDEEAETSCDRVTVNGESTGGRGVDSVALTGELVRVQGDPYAEIVRLADERKVDAVVVGASTSAGHRIVGSLAGRLVRAGKWPVTVVP